MQMEIRFKKCGISNQPEEMLTFFSNEFPSAFPHEIPKCISCNITYHPKRSMLVAAIPYYPSLTDSHQDFFYVLYIKLHMHLGFRLLLKFLHLHRI